MRIYQSLSVENKILLCVARVVLDEQTKARLTELLSLKIDWEELLSKAHAHRLTPLLWFHLKHFKEKLPSETRHRLETLYQENLRRSFFQTGELIKLCKLFDADDIPVIPYKGPALAAQIYGDISLREFADLDLLIRWKDVHKARKLLLEHGFQMAVEIPDEKFNLYSRSECDQVFTRNETGVYLELHWALTPPYFCFHLTTEELLNNAVDITLSGRKLKGFNAEELLLVLCVNGTKEIWRRLEWLCTIAELIKQNPRMDWGRVQKEAQKYKSERMLFVCLYLVRELFDAALPEDVNKMLESDKSIPAIADMAIESLFQKERSFSRTRMHLFRLKTRENFFVRVNYCLLRLTTPTYKDITAIRFPRSLFFLYYLVRPSRLIFNFFSGRFGKKTIEQ